MKAGTPSKSNESWDTSKLFFQTILSMVSLNRAWIPSKTMIIKTEPSFKSEFREIKNGRHFALLFFRPFFVFLNSDFILRSILIAGLF